MFIIIRNGHANGQERLGTNSGKRSRFKIERNTVRLRKSNYLIAFVFGKSFDLPITNSN